MSWTQKELEELYQKISKALSEDPAFREKMHKDARAAAEELAGRPLEEGFRLDFIEQDAGYGDTYVLPDFVGEELDPRELGAIAGGKNVKSVSGGDCQKDSVNGASVLTVVSTCPAASVACAIDSCPGYVPGCPDYCGAYACVTETSPPCTDYTGPCAAYIPSSTAVSTCPGYVPGCPDYCGAYACVTETSPPCTDDSSPCAAYIPSSDGGFGFGR